MDCHLFPGLRQSGSVPLKVGDGLDVDDGWHSDPCAVMGLNVDLNLVVIKKFAELHSNFNFSTKCWTRFRNDGDSFVIWILYLAAMLCSIKLALVDIGFWAMSGPDP
jgi:hypothetical protein